MVTSPRKQVHHILDATFSSVEKKEDAFMTNAG